jgi:hypothetical protein
MFFLAAFVAGLCLAVYSMLHGVERSKKSARQRPSAIFNAPTVSVFGIVLGATGYLLITHAGFGLVTILVIGLVVASAATAGMITLISLWALPYSGTGTESETMQGQLALVTSPISAFGRGEIAFDTDGVRRTLAAQSIHGGEIPSDTEVVIDTVEDGVARVELWSAVEQRL